MDRSHCALSAGWPEGLPSRSVLLRAQVAVCQFPPPSSLNWSSKASVPSDSASKSDISTFGAVFQSQIPAHPMPTAAGSPGTVATATVGWSGRRRSEPTR